MENKEETQDQEYVYNKKIHEEIKSNSKFITIIMCLLIGSSFYFQIKVNSYEDQIKTLEEQLENRSSFKIMQKDKLIKQIQENGVLNVDSCLDYAIKAVKNDYPNTNILSGYATFYTNSEDLIDTQKYVNNCVKLQSNLSSTSDLVNAQEN